MSTPTVLNNATIWLGGYDLTGATNEITFNAARAELNSSRFGDSVEAVHPGAMQVDAEVKGYFDSALDGPLVTQLQSPTEAWPLTICPDGGDMGEPAYTIQAYNFAYAVFETGWGESLPYRVSGKSKSGGTLDAGRIVLPRGETTAAAFKYQIGAVSASQKIITTLQVFVSVGTWAPRLRSDADAGVGGEVSRVIFIDVASAPSFQTMEVAGPITDEWWFGQLTGGTSITAAMTMAIVDA